MKVAKGYETGGKSFDHLDLAGMNMCRLDDGTEPSFSCERVCTSDRLMRRMGGLSKVC